MVLLNNLGKPALVPVSGTPLLQTIEMICADNHRDTCFGTFFLFPLARKTDRIRVRFDLFSVLFVSPWLRCAVSPE